MSLPRPISPMVDFSQRLRDAGFPVSADQTVGFIAAVGTLGPHSMTDIHRAGLALFAVVPERRAEYDAVFREIFLGQGISAEAVGDGEDVVQAHEPTGTDTPADAEDGEDSSGQEASLVEHDGYRVLHADDLSRVLGHFKQQLPRRLPQRKTFRRRRATRGQWLDVRRTLKEAARADGDVLRLRARSRVLRPRKILILLDVSGSMSSGTESMLTLAHAVVQGAPQVEVFTLGTRLTRITAALGPSNLAHALDRSASLIGDMDGGTRLGVVLGLYMSVPRYSVFARGAAVVVVSDGLERDEPGALVDAVARLRRLAWRLDWLTPLASDPHYRPETAAMAMMLPHLSTLGAGGNTADVADHILNLARAS